MKKLNFLVLLFVIVSLISPQLVLAQEGDNQQDTTKKQEAQNGVDESKKGGESKEPIDFKIVSGDPLDLDVLKDSSGATSHSDQPGFVNVEIVFDSKTDSLQVGWMPYMPHAGKQEFFELVERIIKTWKFTDIEVDGIILYTISTNGTITINLKSLNLPDYVNYKFPAANELVVSENFVKKNIRSIMKKGQMYGKVDVSWLEKLGTTYQIIFAIIALVFFVSLVVTALKMSSKINPKQDIINIISKLWTSINLDFNNRGIDYENPDLKLELEHIDLMVKDLSQEESSIRSDDKVYKDRNGNEIQIADDDLPGIEYKELGETINNFVKEHNDIEGLSDLIWTVYSDKFLSKAIEICKKYDQFAMCRIFLAGLENHRGGKDKWYSSQEIDRAIDRTAASELECIKGWLDWIWVIGSIAPMCGLFGTVTGISSAFAEISQTSSGMEQSELITKLAGGINTALYTTIVGLAIGIFATLAYYWFKVRLDSISTKWEKIFVDISNHF